MSSNLSIWIFLISLCFVGVLCGPDCEHGTVLNGVCKCEPGWEGPHCNDMICYHGGTYEGGHHKHCKCTPFYTGHNCETSLFPQQHDKFCDPNPCLNNGHCFHDSTAFFCDCPAGFTGTKCQDKVITTSTPAPTQSALCLSNTCQNGGHCYHDDTSYYCSCPSGFTGKHCELCTPTTCKNGGHCFHDDTSFFCWCSSGFTGKHCENQVVQTTTVASGASNDACRFSPCVRGLCLSTDTKVGYYCYCPTGYTGVHCEIECSSNPCLNSGHCFDDATDYVCVCNGNYTGKNCETDMSTSAAVTPNPGSSFNVPVYKTCNEIDLIVKLAAGGRVVFSNARTCPKNNTIYQSEAILMKHCSAPVYGNWRKGVQVSTSCQQVPKYTAVAQFHHNIPTDRSGVFLKCDSDNFQMLTQTCQSDFKIEMVEWPESDSFYTVEW